MAADDVVIPVIVKNGAGVVSDDLRVEVVPSAITLVSTTGESRIIAWQTIVVRQAEFGRTNSE